MGGCGPEASLQKNVRAVEARRKTDLGTTELGELQIEEKVDCKQCEKRVSVFTFFLLQETIFKNYSGIEFFPEKFTEYLLSSVVGFAKREILGYPNHHSKGFRRPIQVFTKSTMFPSERIEATPNNITPNNPVYDDSLYQRIMKTEKYESQTQPQVEKSEHIYYTNILNRYCGNSDENFEANHLIEEDLNKMKTSNDEKTCDGLENVSGDNT